MKNIKSEGSILQRVGRLAGILFAIVFLCLFSEMNAEAKGLIITEYSIDSGVAVYGQECEIEVTVYNTSDDYVTDVLVSVNTNEFLYPIYGNPNQVYVGTIEAHGTQTFKYSFEISEKASGIINVPITMEYYIGPEAASDSNYTFLAIPVGNMCEFTINSVNLEQNATVASQVMLSIKYENAGDSTIKNVVMHLEGSIEEENKTVEIGELSSGKQKYQDYYVSFLNTGEQNLEVYFTYEDELGNEYETQGVQLSTNIKENAGKSPVFSADGQDNAAYDEAKTIILFCGVLILVIVVIVAIMRWRKK